MLLSAPKEIRNDYARLRRHLKLMFGGVQRIDWTASLVGASRKLDPKKLVALIDLNLATNAQLLKVEQIGHALASRLIAGQPFKDWDAVRAVPQIGKLRAGYLQSSFFIRLADAGLSQGFKAVPVAVAVA
jgi:hypothetical protein